MPGKPFKVIVPDPWSFLNRDAGPAPESEHATREDAEARCREIVSAELQRRFDASGSWTEALRDYLNSRSMVYVASGGRCVDSFTDYARAWTAEQLAANLSAAMDRIISTLPETPRGWFRWLHHTQLSRYPAHVDLALAEEWRAVGEWVALDPSRINSLLLINVEAHAWEIGCLELRPLIEHCWPKLTPGAKGLSLAGSSHSKELSDWVLTHLPEAELTAEGILEIACNAAWNDNLPLFKAVMEREPSALLKTVERMEPFGRGPSHKSRWAKHLERLSNRMVDMALEACVVIGWVPGARLALDLGANPDLAIWVLERSYNEHHSALSYSIKERHWELVEVLIAAGVRRSGTADARPLFLAIAASNDVLAEELIVAGMGFGPGDKPDWLAASRPGDDIERKRAVFFNCSPEDLDRAQRLGAELPLVHASETDWFVRAHALGGFTRTMVSEFFAHDEVERLRRFVDLGLPLRLASPDFSHLIACGAYACLCWIIREWDVPPRLMWRIRREVPDFGTGRRLWMVRPDARRVGILPEFLPGDQTPLELPDGGRLWVDLSGLAGGEDQPGPVTPGTLWVRKCRVSARRRSGGVVLRHVSQTWELEREPQNDHQLRDLLPVVKEIDGVFLFTGMTMGRVWWADYPIGGDGKDWIKEWAEGAAWERLRPRVVERLNAQRAGHQTAPRPVLDGEELAPFPVIFHPWLRRGADGLIRLDESAAAKFPVVITDYREWESLERRHEREWRPDDRCLAWSAWKDVPADLRPWFDWDEMFQRPRPMDPRSERLYETGMCRRALSWWNSMMISGVRDALG